MRVIAQNLRSALKNAAMLVFLPFLFVGLLPCAEADDFAYEATGTDQFGVIDLNTGVFTQSGNMGALLSGLGVAGSNLYGGKNATGILEQVNLLNGSLTPVGTGNITYYAFGSTTSGLYALDSSLRLYSINSQTGVATFIGSTGLTPAGVGGVSTNSTSLYLTNGPNLYSLNSTTGAATLIGPTGISIGAMVFENGKLYAGAYTLNDVYTLNPNTGAATFLANVSGGATTFWGLAPEPLPQPISEPSSLLVLVTSLGGLTMLLRRDQPVK